MATAFILAGEKQETGEKLAVYSPYDGALVGETFLATAEQAQEAAQKAKAAFEITRKMPSHQRGKILRRVSQIIEERSEEATQIMCAEAGKPIRDCRGEVARAAHTFLVASEEARRLEGEFVPLDLTPGNEGKMGFVKRFPIGTVLGITPFNFPLNLVAHKFAPTIACGNPIIIKPASKTPLSALKLGEWILEAGMPPEAISVLPCKNDIATALLQNAAIAMLSFTGSEVVGWKLKELAGRKKVALELGGNAGNIVHADASIADASTRCVKGGFYYAGQSCISVQRLYLHRAIAKAFLDDFIPKVRAQKVGDPKKEDTDVGPVIDDGAAERIERQIKQAVEEGAKILCGGERNGRMIEPTVLANVNNTMEVVCTEAFAPLVVVEEYEDFAEAMTRLNDSPFGLQAGIFTHDSRIIQQAFDGLEVGGIIVNDVSNWRIDHMPYGGIKASGLGREGPRYAIEEMTERRLLVMAQA